MRVGLIIYGGLDILSGGYLYDRYLVEFLQENGDEVRLVSLPITGYLGQLSHNIYSRELNELAFENLANN